MSEKQKSGIPKNPGRHDLGMKATMLFPDRDIVEKSYVPIIYTACRTCYSELPPEEIYRRAEAGEIDPAKQRELVSRVIESGHGSTSSAAANSPATHHARPERIVRRVGIRTGTARRAGSGTAYHSSPPCPRSR